MEKEDNAGVKIPPPFIYMIFFAVGIVISEFFPLRVFGNLFFRFLGILLMLYGVELAREAILLFRKNQTSLIPDNPASRLVREGVYIFTRNPMYLSMFLFYEGVSILSNFLWPIILSPILFLIVNNYVVPKEESYLERKFGEDYFVYKSFVRRWL